MILKLSLLFTIMFGQMQGRSSDMLWRYFLRLNDQAW